MSLLKTWKNPIPVLTPPTLPLFFLSFTLFTHFSPSPSLLFFLNTSLFFSPPPPPSSLSLAPLCHCAHHLHFSHTSPSNLPPFSSHCFAPPLPHAAVILCPPPPPRFSSSPLVSSPYFQPPPPLPVEVGCRRCHDNGTAGASAAHPVIVLVENLRVVCV